MQFPRKFKSIRILQAAAEYVKKLESPLEVVHGVKLKPYSDNCIG